MSGAARILITGGTGFFGKSLLAARKREAVPEGELVILSRDPEGFLCRFPAFAGLPGRLFCGGRRAGFSVSGRRIFSRPACRDARPAPGLRRRTRRRCVRSSSTATKRVLNFCRSRKVPRLLLTSSGAVYGPQEPECERMAETHPCRPVTAYGQGKLEAERLCLDSGVETVIARCFAFVGPYLPLGIHFAAGQFSARRAGKPPDCDPRGRAAAAQLSVCGRPWSAGSGGCLRRGSRAASTTSAAKMPYRSRSSRSAAPHCGRRRPPLRFSGIRTACPRRAIFRIRPGPGGNSAWRRRSISTKRSA